MSDALKRLEQGARYPYDATDNWWKDAGVAAPPAADWAHHAARGIMADLTDRRGIKYSFDNIDEDVRIEIVTSLAEIIRIAQVIEVQP